MGTTTKSKKAADKTEALAKSAAPAPKLAKSPVKASAEAPAPKTTASKSPQSSQKAASPPTQEQIALRAYYIAEDRRRAGNSGCPESDWLLAERSVQAELA